MAGGLRGGQVVKPEALRGVAGRAATGENKPLASTDAMNDPLAGLYASAEVLPRMINFRPAKSPDAHSMGGSQLVPLNDLKLQRPLSRDSLKKSSDDTLALKSALPGKGDDKTVIFEAVKAVQSGGSGTSKEEGCELQLTWRSVRGVGAGLANQGNTCFLNSVLQCLTYTPPLVYFLESSRHPTCQQGAPFCALCELRRHVSKALTITRGVVVPNGLVKGLRNIARSFKLGRQEDAHEYMRYLLEALHKACLPPSVARNPAAAAKANSFVQHCFGGRLRSQVKCTVCQFCSNTFDPFLDLSLDIHRADSLPRALQRFTASEVLDGENKYKCRQCKKKVRAQKCFSIEKVPPVLTIQLKRFSSITGGKIDKWVQFGTTLDLSPYVSNEQEGLQYSLYAVLVHAGWSTHSGHYFGFVRTSSGIWHEVNDTQVRQVSEKTVLQQKAYILFYIRSLPAKAEGKEEKKALKEGSSEKKEERLEVDNCKALREDGKGGGTEKLGKVDKVDVKTTENVSKEVLKSRKKSDEKRVEDEGKVVDGNGAVLEIRKLEVASVAADHVSNTTSKQSIGESVVGSEGGSKSLQTKVAVGSGLELKHEEVVVAVKSMERQEKDEKEREDLLTDVAEKEEMEEEDEGVGEGVGANSDSLILSEDDYRKFLKERKRFRRRRLFIRFLMAVPSARQYFSLQGGLLQGRKRRKAKGSERGERGRESKEEQTSKTVGVLRNLFIPGRRITRGLLATLMSDSSHADNSVEVNEEKGEEGDISVRELGTLQRKQGFESSMEQRAADRVVGQITNQKETKTLQVGEVGGKGVYHGNNSTGEKEMNGAQNRVVRITETGSRVIEFGDSGISGRDDADQGWTIAGSAAMIGGFRGNADGEDGIDEEKGIEEREVRGVSYDEGRREGADSREPGSIGKGKGKGEGQEKKKKIEKVVVNVEVGAHRLRGAAAMEALRGPMRVKGEEFSVPQWEDGTANAPQPKEVLQKEPKARRREYDEWDAELDKGRMKKVKSKETADEQNERPYEGNPFQDFAAAKGKSGHGGKQEKGKKGRRQKKGMESPH